MTTEKGNQRSIRVGYPMSRLRFAGILVFSFWLIGFTLACQRQTTPDTRAADERVIRDADIEWSGAAAAKDLERTVSFYADDASMRPPNAPIATGKEAIRAVWSQLLQSPGFGVSWQPTKVEVSSGSDLGYTIGTYELTMNDPEGKPVTDHGKYVEVWKKQPDGNWKVVADIFNSNLPSLAAATPAPSPTAATPAPSPAAATPAP